MEKKKMTVEDLRSITANPFYCLPRVDPIFSVTHEPLVSEEIWIATAEKSIKEHGTKDFLINLLKNLKGQYL